MTFCTKNVKTAGFLNCNSFFLDLNVIFFIKLTINLTGCKNFLIVSICKTDSFSNNFFRIFSFSHFSLSKKFSVTAEHNISTTSCHVCSDCNSSEFTCLSYDFSFFCVVFCVKNFMLDTFSFQHCRKKFWFFNWNSTNKYRLTFLITFNDFINNCMEFTLFSTVNLVIVIYSFNRFVCRNSNNIELIDFLEFIFLGHSSTGHTWKLAVQTEEILERNCSKRLRLTSNLYAFLSFNSLMQTIIETTSEHKTACKFINNDNFTVFNNVVNISFHNTMSFDCLIYMMKKSHIIRIHQVFNIESFFCLFNASSCNCSGLSLFVDNVIGCFIYFILILLVINLNNSSRNKSFSKFIYYWVKLGRFVTASGNNKRCSCFINENRVNLIDNRKIRFSLHPVFFLYNHVVTKIVKSEFIICCICNITVVSCTSFFIIKTMKDTSNSKTEKTMNFSHFFSLSFSKIVVNGNNVNTFTA